MRLIWFGKVKYWAIDSKKLVGTGCRNSIDEKTVFDIHIESPAYDVDNHRFCSVMLNVDAFRPDDTSMFPNLNKNPLYDTMKQIPFDVNKVVLLEVTSYTTMKMHDCIWIHDFKKTTDLQIVPNKIDYFVELFGVSFWKGLVL